MVLYALENAWGGEVFVPKIPSYNIMELAKAISPKAKKPIIGIRPGEKLHEEMITESDSFNTIELNDYYVIMPSVPSWKEDAYLNHFKGKKVNPKS